MANERGCTDTIGERLSAHHGRGGCAGNWESPQTGLRVATSVLSELPEAGVGAADSDDAYRRGASTVDEDAVREMIEARLAGMRLKDVALRYGSVRAV